MDGFISWGILQEYASLVAVVFMVVEFTKDLKFIKVVPTRYWSFIVSFLLIIIVNVQRGSFIAVDVVLYALTAVSISLGSNGLSDFNYPKDYSDEYIEEEYKTSKYD